ncbi:MAG: preprotein translocase subunit YajC [Desulfovibrionaceae bacterium]|nr:preprotein translocase subunit YajC [Desulfovibrionaceae bacterium]
MAAPQGAAGAAPSGTDMLMQFLPLILMFVIFYFLLIRPQQKRAKAHKAMLAALKKGDYIITSAGFLGRILELDEETVLIECGEAKLRMSRGAIGNVVDKDGKNIEPEKK